MELAKKYFYLLTGFTVFIIYLYTLAPSVQQIDSGELATVQATLGIAHPTGYPLFTIIGYIFSLIPLPFTKIFQLNILAALFCSTGISVFVYTAKLLLDNLDAFSTSKAKTEKQKKVKKKSRKDDKKKNEQGTSLSEITKYIAAIAGGLILAFSETYWLQSTSVEVYSLHILLMNIIILFLVKAFLYVEKEDKASDLKLWLTFSLFLALGFTNHMTTLLIIPGVAYLFFLKYKLSKTGFKKIFLMLAVFFPILILLYAYLPLRAFQNPLLNWGNPTDFEKLLRHITGKQYQVWLFASTAAAKKQLVYFIETLPGQFSIGLLISFIGLFASYFYARKFFIFLIITFLFTVFYSINYEINDIDPYFLLAYISLSYFAVFGSLKLLTLSKRKKMLLPVGIVVVIITIQFIMNAGKVNQSGIYTYEDYTRAILNSVSDESIIFSYQWDFFVSPSYYFRYVEDYRSDVAVVDKELLRRSWYFDQLNNNYPFVLNKIEEIVDQFKTALLPFERSENYNATLLESLYRRLMTGMVATNVDERDFYIAPELLQNEMQRGEFSLPQGYKLIPDLLLFKVVRGDEYVPAADPDFEIRFSDRKSYYLERIKYYTGFMLMNRVNYELQNGKTERAKVYLRKLKKALPDYPIPLTLKNATQDY
jgi:Protein O-mannosyl-transferase TMEM260-like